MAKENCSLCGKNTGFWGRFELKDGYICDACFDSAKCIKYDLDIFKTTTYTVNMLQNIVNDKVTTKSAKNTEYKQSGNEEYDLILISAGENKYSVIKKIREITGCSLSKAQDIIDHLPQKMSSYIAVNFAQEAKNDLEEVGAIAEIEKVKKVHTDNDTFFQGQVMLPEQQLLQEFDGASVSQFTSVTSESEGCFTGCKKIFNGIINGIEIILVIIFLYLLISGKLYIIGGDLLAKFNNGEHYIEMVQNLSPTDYNTSYLQAYSETFDKNTWEYFKSDDKRVVQITSSYEDLADDLITQFIITPTGEDGQYEIEIYAMNLSGNDLSQGEIALVMASIFQDELIEALGALYFNYTGLIN